MTIYDSQFKWRLTSCFEKTINESRSITYSFDDNTSHNFTERNYENCQKMDGIRRKRNAFAQQWWNTFVYSVDSYILDYKAWNKQCTVTTQSP